MSGGQDNPGTSGAVAAHFANHRYVADLPTAWGPPPEGSTKYSPERALWVRRMVETHTVEGRTARLAELELRGQGQRYPTDRPAVEARLAYLRLPPPGG